MELSTTEEAMYYIQKKVNNSPEELSIVFYQYNKMSCAGSYQDYVVEIDLKDQILQQNIYENWSSMGNNLDCIVDVYIEKRLREEWEKSDNILLDLKVTYKFEEKYESLYLKEAKGIE
jgi:hypothetical protein